MTTEQIAESLQLTAKLQELHGENPYKVKALSNAAYKLDKTGIELAGKSLQELEQIEGIGKGIAAKIDELLKTGTTKELQELLTKTPVGVIDMLSIKGLGAKKVAQLWHELGAESLGELLYACYENRLVDLKGFGSKTQESVKKAIEYKIANAGKYHYYAALPIGETILTELRKLHPEVRFEFTGELRRKENIISSIQIICDAKIELNDSLINQFPIQIELIPATTHNFGTFWFQTTGAPAFMAQLEQEKISIGEYSDEAEVFRNLNWSYIEPEMREGIGEILIARKHQLPKLIEVTDLRGNLHNHSKWSDGMNTVQEMATFCQEKGFEYFAICDHSKSAFYANGLSEERVLEQHREVDQLNATLNNFKIFKGIESDILNDGNLDYDPDILKTFDLIVASVHSVLKMDEARATARLIKAIENPYTRILGHPSGRLLLSREGYPLDYKKIIDACAANNVAVELNAHPYRLDIDWRWIPYCMEKDVLISINPDAHEKEGLLDVKWGIISARKGWLTKEHCLNAKSLAEFEQWLQSK
jgi:DNA polymerase (family 10)